MEWLVPVLIAVGIIIFYSRKDTGTTTQFPYKSKTTLFSPAERSFLGVLTQAVSNNALIFGKVRIADILEPTKGLNRSNWQKAFNKITSKHFDYVICNPDDLSVISVVELDDKSHSRNKQIARDEFIQGACDSAGLKLHRFKASASYNVAEVRERLFPPPTSETVPTEQVQSPDFPIEETNPMKLCPKCSSKLVRRVAGKGSHAGEPFIGCSAFPKCKYIAKPGA